jgi:hypothetical protein
MNTRQLIAHFRKTFASMVGTNDFDVGKPYYECLHPNKEHGEGAICPCNYCKIVYTFNAIPLAMAERARKSA